MVTLEMWGQSTIFLYRWKLSFLTLETCDFYAREIIICYSQNVRSVYNLFIPMKIIIPYSRKMWLLCTRNNYLLLSKCEVSLQFFLYRWKLSFLTLETCDFYAREIIIGYSRNVGSVYNLFIPMKIIIPYSRNVWLLCTRNNYLLLSKCEVSLQSFYTDENYHSLLSKRVTFMHEK